MAEPVSPRTVDPDDAPRPPPGPPRPSGGAAGAAGRDDAGARTAPARATSRRRRHRRAAAVARWRPAPRHGGRDDRRRRRSRPRRCRRRPRHRRRHRRPFRRTTVPGPPRTSCTSVIHLGDSTSVSLISPSFIADPEQRVDAQYRRVGALDARTEIDGALSTSETLDGQINAFDRVNNIKADGYEGCWVFAIGGNDTANLAKFGGSIADRVARIDRMMSAVGDDPVMWVNVKTLRPVRPWYGNEHMQEWNAALQEALPRVPEHAGVRLGLGRPGRVVPGRRHPLHVGRQRDAGGADRRRAGGAVPRLSVLEHRPRRSDVTTGVRPGGRVQRLRRPRQVRRYPAATWLRRCGVRGPWLRRLLALVALGLRRCRTRRAPRRRAVDVVHGDRPHRRFDLGGDGLGVVPAAGGRSARGAVRAHRRPRHPPRDLRSALGGRAPRRPAQRRRRRRGPARRGFRRLLGDRHRHQRRRQRGGRVRATAPASASTG